MTIDQVIDEALRLTSKQRAVVVDRLLASLGPDEDFEITPAWRDEITRRLAAVESGEMALIDGDEVFEKMRRMLDR